MQTTEKIKLSNIPPGTVGLVRGRVTFSRIANLVEGQKLEEANQRAVSRGGFPAQRPYTSITIENPEFTCDHPDMKALLEQKCYRRKADNTLCFEARSPVVPSIGHLDQTTGRAQELMLERELDKGVEVQLLMSVYYSKRNNKNGLGLNNVTILDPEIRYWGNQSVEAGIASAMAITGMIWVPMRPEERLAARNRVSAQHSQPQYHPNQYVPSLQKPIFVPEQAYQNPWAD